MAQMADGGNVACEVAEQRGISISTLDAYVDGDRECARQTLSDRTERHTY
jgi:hypothetical protein